MASETLCHACARKRHPNEVGQVPIFGEDTLTCTSCSSVIDPKVWPFCYRTPDPDEPIVPVILRRDPPKEGGRVFALFPTIPHDYRLTATAFQHVGQHCGANYHGCITGSKPVPADHPDAVELLRELTSSPYFYQLRVVRRATRAMHDESRAQVRRWIEDDQKRSSDV